MNERKIVAACVTAIALATCTAVRAGEPVSTLGEPGCMIVNPHPHAGESATWSGGCRDGMADGDGTVELFRDGTRQIRFVGHLRAGVVDGPVVLDVDPIHLHYEGSLVDDRFEGPGKLTQSDGARVTAQFVKGEPVGDVDAVLPDGVRYHGGWKGSHAEGQGVAIDPRGTSYTGGFHRGVPEGPGVVVFDGSSVRGTWTAGRQSGAVVADTPGGAHYEGDAQDLHPQGEGVMRYADGGVYRGGFVAGKRQGQGTLTAANGAVIYSGGFGNDLYDGQGRMLCADGAWYEGTLVAGQRKGHGKMTGPTGVMEGEFSDDPQEFRGVLVDQAGNRTEGRWVNWRYEGEMLLVSGAEVKRASYHDGLLEGPSDSRLRGGAHIVSNFHAGLLEGPFRAELPDGGVVVGQYRAGLMEGRWVTADRDGQVTSKEFRGGEPVAPPVPAPAPPPAASGLSS